MPFSKKSRRPWEGSAPTEANTITGLPTAPAQTTDVPETKPNSTRETDSLAPLVNDGAGEGSSQVPTARRKSWFKRLSGGEEKKEKRKSISESGPFVFAFDPSTGKSVLQKNPHWPEEDSWKREKDSQGWAMGSMMGPQNVDFGGTVG